MALIGGAMAAGAAHAVDLPEDRAEALIHRYEGGGVTAYGPALLVRKRMADQVSLSGQYYVDMVSNASIDVVTTASPFRETRHEVSLGLDVAHRDALVSLSASRSQEPDYTATTVGIDASQEVFGGMTTVSLGFSRGSDDVGRKDEGMFDQATHWQYRLGVSQILSPRWIASLNTEVVADSGYLGNPYRVARIYGAAVPERMPRTRTSRAIKARVIGDIGGGNALRGEYRYFWDTWDISAHTVELGWRREWGTQWLTDAFVRYGVQSAALFYSDNATTETTYLTRNRQLSDFNNVGLGATVQYAPEGWQARWQLKLNAALELVRFDYAHYTDLRDGSSYSFNGSLLQLYVTAKF